MMACHILGSFMMVLLYHGSFMTATFMTCVCA